MLLRNKTQDNVEWDQKFAEKGKDFYDKVIGTIGSFGKQLFFAENKEVVFKTWNASTHRELARLLGSHKVKEDFQDGRIFKKMLYVLQFMCVRFAGKDLWLPNDKGYTECLKEHERKSWIAEHHETDVILAYILLHMASRDDIMSIELENDGRQVPVSFDLNGIEFIGSEKIEDALFVYNLKNPINIRGTKVSKMVIGPTSFSSVCEIPLSADLEKTNFDVIAHLAASIYYLPEKGNDRVTIISQELNNLSYNDIKGIKEAIGEHYIGIQTIIEVEDKELDKKFKAYFPWYDPDFLV